MLFASGIDSRARLGRSGRLTGSHLFVKISNNLAFLGLPGVDYPPAWPEFEEDPVAGFTITNSGSAIGLQLAAPDPATPPISVNSEQPTRGAAARGQ